MIRRLAEVIYDEGFSSPTPEQITFWLREVRTPELLDECVRSFPDDARQIAKSRVAVAAALAGDTAGTRDALDAEEAHERQLDRLYWEPLKAELETLRHQRFRGI